MMIYADKVEVKCLTCQQTGITDMVYGRNDKYPDDFEIQCPNPECGVWEEGTPPLQNFIQIKDYGRRDLSDQKEERNMDSEYVYLCNHCDEMYDTDPGACDECDADKGIRKVHKGDMGL